MQTKKRAGRKEERKRGREGRREDSGKGGIVDGWLVGSSSYYFDSWIL